MDKGRKEVIADSGEQGVEADFGCTNVYTCGSIAGRVGNMKIKLSFARYMTKTPNGLLAAIYGKLIKEHRPGSRGGGLSNSGSIWGSWGWTSLMWTG